MDLLDVAKSLISFPTESPPGDEEGCARFIRDSLQDLHMEGAEFELNSFQTGRSNLVARFGGRPHGLLLAGHMDVVPVRDGPAWSSPPFEAEVRDGRMYGRGAADMKSALAAMMAAIASTKGERLNRGIVFVATAGEEIGYDGLHALIEAGKGDQIKADYGIVGEPTEMRVVRAHRGGVTCRVTFEGRSAHASNPALGVNSIENCVACIQRLDGLRAELSAASDPDLGVSIVTPTEIRGGTKSNVIPESCELTLDCRLIPAHDPETIVAGLNRIIEDLRGGEKKKIFDAKVEAMYAARALSLPEESDVVKIAVSLTGAPAVVAPYGTEAPLYCQLGIPTVVLGPGSIKQAHIRDEYVEVRELEAARQVYERFIRKVCL